MRNNGLVGILCVVGLIALSVFGPRDSAAETTYNKGLEPVKVDLIHTLETGFEIHRIVDYQQDRVCYVVHVKSAVAQSISCTEGTR